MQPNDTTYNEEEEVVTPEVKVDNERVEILDGLARKIEETFEERAVARLPKESEWVDSLSLYNAPLADVSRSSITSDDPFGRKAANKRRPEPNIIRTKCDTALANCVSMQFAAGEKNWDLFPPANTKDPQVTEACRLMEKEIEYQLDCTKYPFHARRAMEERVILGTGVLKGPVNTGKMKVKYERLSDGTWVPKVDDAKEPRVEYVSVWRFYPDMTVTEYEEGCDTIELHPMTSLELSQYRNHPGFDKEAIDEILYGDGDKKQKIKPSTYNDSYAKITPEVWGRSPYLYKDRYQVLEYHGPVTYDDLCKLGLEPTYESPTMEYFGEVWVCCGKVIRMELENIEGYYETPYCVSHWKRDPTSPFGFGHPQLLADAQRVVTQSYHMILDNASLTSAPQVAMYRKYIQPVDGTYEMGPGKAWLLTDPTVNINNAIQFFNPTNVIGNIMPVLQLARQFAEEESATATFGTSPSPQNQDSATGQLIMQHASTTLLDFFSEEWDDQVTEKLIRRMYAWNMQYNDKPEIKGNYSVDVKSSTEYKNKQMAVRDLERLSMEAAQNPEMAISVNMDELTRARLATMHLPSGRIVKSVEEVAAARQQQANQPNPQMVELQIKMMEADMRKAELALKQAQLQFEMQQAQQREAWEHQEKMGSNKAREMEAQAQVLKARSEVQVEMIKLASKDKQFMAKLQNDKEIASLDTHAQVFLKSMEEERKNEEVAAYNREIDLAATKGEGI